MLSNVKQMTDERKYEIWRITTQECTQANGQVNATNKLGDRPFGKLTELEKHNTWCEIRTI